MIPPPLPTLCNSWSNLPKVQYFLICMPIWKVTTHSRLRQIVPPIFWMWSSPTHLFFHPILGQIVPHSFCIWSLTPPPPPPPPPQPYGPYLAPLLSLLVELSVSEVSGQRTKEWHFSLKYHVLVHKISIKEKQKFLNLHWSRYLVFWQ